MLVARQKATFDLHQSFRSMSQVQSDLLERRCFMSIVGKVVESCVPNSRSSAVAWSIFILVLAFLIYWTASP